MKKHLSLSVAAILALVAAAHAGTPAQPVLGYRTTPVIRVDGVSFKDLNRNGRLDLYEDWRQTPAARAADLAGRMGLEEKAGLLMHGNPPGLDGGLRNPWDMAAIALQIRDRHIRFYINRVSVTPRAMASMANAAQKLAEESPLGIPLVISSDPRNHFQATFGLSVSAGKSTQWPEPPGMAATGNPDLVREFGRIAAREYRAMGITMALSPMADLASEPRWPRTNGTFGDDPAKVERFVQAYVEGFQGAADGLAPGGVAAVVKHWAGYGAQPEGYDAHNPYGRDIAFPGGWFDRHVAPFKGAFRAHATGVMPTYGKLPADITVNGRPVEPVAAGFSRQMLTELLRDTYRFDGFVLTDWKITDDCLTPCLQGTLKHDEVGMPWGVEDLSKSERFAKALDAGVDQFGGVMDPDILARLVESGRITTDRVDLSVRRMLVVMFQLGLFENPYVDADAAEAIVGNPGDQEKAMDAQRRSLVLLEAAPGVLPLDPKAKPRVWLWKMDATGVAARGFTVVDSPEQADIALLRIATPFTTRPAFFFGSRHHEGSLAFAPDNPDRVAVERAAAAGLPVIVSTYLDRPAILGPIKDKASVLIGDFGASDAALLDMLTGKARFQGRLPFELPSSMQAVERQLPDVSADSEKPLYPSGFGRDG